MKPANVSTTRTLFLVVETFAFNLPPHSQQKFNCVRRTIYFPYRTAQDSMEFKYRYYCKII